MELLRRRISSSAAKLDPHAVWNAFVDLLANSTLVELTDIQRHPHLVFWYESEVQNGGHLQFFENRPEELIEPTLTALRVLGAEAYLPILNDATLRWRSQPREKLETVEEYASTGLHGEFEDLDRAFYDAEPPLTQLLENYLDDNVSEFVLVERNE